MGVWIKDGCPRKTAQTIITEWTAEKCSDKRVQSKQARQANKQTVESATLAAQIAKSSLGSNGNNAKDNVD